MKAKGEKHISWTGPNDKRSITLTLCKSHNGTILPFQHFTLYKKRKAARSLSNVAFAEDFSLSHNGTHRTGLPQW